MSSAPSWTPGEEDALRRVLAVRPGEPDEVGPVPWSVLERTHRRATVRRRTGLVLVAATVALAAGGLTGAVPGVGSLRSVVSPASEGVGPRTDGPVVGSLAGDSTFVEAVRLRAVAELTQPGSLGPRVDVTDLRVLVATDVEGGRMVLVGFDGGTAWLTGPRGAPADRLYVGDVGGDVVWTRYGVGYTVLDDRKPDGTIVREPNRGEGVVVAAPPGARVTVRGGNDVTADGVVRRETVVATERWPGFYVAPFGLPTTRYDVTVDPADGPPVSEWASGGSSVDLDAWWVAGSGTTEPPVTDPVTRGDLVSAFSRAAGMLPADGGRVLAQQVDGDRTWAVLAFPASSGGWVRGVVEKVATGDEQFRLTTYAVEALPAGDPLGSGLAWRTRDRVYAVGPEGTRTVRRETAAGPSGDVESGSGVVGGVFYGFWEGTDAVRVTFLDDRSVEIGGAAVSPEWPEGTVVS